MASNIFTLKYNLLLIAVLGLSIMGTHLLLSQEKQVDPDAQIDTALGYSVNGNHAEAVKLLMPLAEDGVDRAKLYLGVAYYHGNGVAKNTQRARVLFFDLQNKNYEPGIVSTYLNLIGSLPES